MLSNNVPVWMIQISDNEISQYYKNHCLPSWTDRDYVVNMFEAITPDTLGDELEFGWLKSNKSKRKFTETEKAVWYSHYYLWAQCTEPMIIIEHDTMTYGKFDITPSMNFKFLAESNKGLAPASAYYLTPATASDLISECTGSPITLNVDGYMYGKGKSNMKVCKPIIHYEIGTTIIHK